MIDEPIFRPPERPTGTYEARSRLGRRLLGTAAACTLVAVGTVITFVLLPNPLTVALCLSLGNGAFALALGCYGFVVVLDLRRRRAL